MSTTNLKRELGSYVVAFVTGSDGKLTPVLAAQLTNGIIEICRENGVVIEMVDPRVPKPTK
jgi:hypothetical protein